MNPLLARKLRRDLWGSRLAVAGLALIMSIGVGSHVAFEGCWRILDRALARYYLRQRLPDAMLSVKRAPNHTLDDVRALPGVREARGRLHRSMLVEVEGEPHPIPGLAVSLPAPRRPVLGDVSLVRGRWFSRPDAPEVLLNEQFARAHDLGPGDTLRAVLNDVQQELRVVGTAEDPENIYVLPPGGGLAPDPARYGLMFAPRRFLEEASSMTGAYDQLLLATHPRDKAGIEEVLDHAERLLADHGVLTRTPMSEAPSVSIMDDELAQLRVNAYLFPSIFLGIAAMVLHLMLGRLVTQQRGVVGTLRALGYSRAAVLRHYCAFGGVVGLAGGLAGCVLGASLQGAMLTMYRQFFALPGIQDALVPELYLGALAASVAAGVLGALQAAWAAARLDPAEAMRPAPPERGGKVVLERLPFLWRRLPFRTRLALRTVLRNPFRSLVGVLATFFATAIVVSSLSMLDSMDEILAHTFVRTAHQDSTLALREPVDARAAGEVARLPGVQASEGHLLAAVQLSRGPRKKDVAVTGLPAGHRLAVPRGEDGDRVRIPREGLVLSEKLARILDVRPGGVVVVQARLGTRARRVAPVVATARTFMGLGAWADRAYLSRLLGEEDVANQVACLYEGSEAPRAFLDEARRRPRVVEVSERRRALDQIEKTMSEMQNASMFILVMLAGSIAFGSVLNTALVSISERQREVATFRSLGYSTAQVGAIFSGESALVNGVGILLGTAGGIGLLYWVSAAYDTELFRFPVVLRAAKVLGCMALMAGFVAAAQGIVLFLVRRLDWLAALKVKE